MSLQHTRTFFLAGSLALVMLAPRTFAQSPQDSTLRDGQHDFDFEVGSFKIHLKRLLHPLTGSTSWVEFDGTSATRKVWDGRAQLNEFETDSPAAGHIEGLRQRDYAPQSEHWSHS